jgi:hypothetical protein
LLAGAFKNLDTFQPLHEMRRRSGDGLMRRPTKRLPPLGRLRWRRRFSAETAFNAPLTTPRAVAAQIASAGPDDEFFSHSLN